MNKDTDARCKCFCLALALCLGPAWLRADAAAGPPPSQKILVITGSDSMADFVKFITQSTPWWSCSRDYNGSGYLAEVQVHNVTVQGTVPALATLQTYDEVWDLRFSAANCQGTVAACGSNGISAAQQADYLSYIAGGGSLFLMGDNGGYPGRNSPIQSIANTVDSASAFQTTVLTTNNDTQQGAYLNIAAATSAENFQSDYRDMTGTERWVAGQYNGLVTAWGNAYPILKDNLTGDGTAFAFDCHNMKPAYQAGKLEIVFDWQMMGGGGQVGYCPPYLYSGTTFGDNERFWENSIDFLVPGSVCTVNSPTPTATRTSTRTATRTATRTVTPSDTRTATPSVTLSSSPSVTPTMTPSDTLTVTRTDSPTLTLTASPTRTGSVTDSPTSSNTATASQTRTATPSHSPTITSSPTQSPLASATVTPTQTPSFTLTDTRTVTPSATPSPTQTVTASASPSVTETRSPTDTPSQTPSLTATPTHSPTSSVTSTSSDTPQFTPTSTPSRTASPSPTMTPSGTGSMTPSQTVTPSFTQTDTRTATPSATPSATQTQTSTHTPSATPTASPSPSATITFSFTVSPTITETPIPVPFRILARVYNSAGELVKTLYDGSSSMLAQSLSPDKGAFVGGQDQVSLPLPGVLADGSHRLLWDGDNANGQWVSAGTYYIKLESTDSFGHVTSLVAPVTVLPGSSDTWLRISNDAGELIWQQHLSQAASGFSLSDATVALSGEGQSAVSGVSAPALQITVRLADGSTTPVNWDGRNGEGRLVASGVYNLTLSSEQPGQGTQVESAKLSVLRGPDADMVGSAVLGPNPAVNVNAVELRYKPQPGVPASAGLYTLDGGRVAQADDGMMSGVLRLPIGGLSGGVYACVFSQGLQRRVLKLAIVR